MKILFIALFLVPTLAFSQASKYRDSLRVTDSILGRYQKVSDTIAMYQQLRVFYAQKAYPNPVQAGLDRKVDSARNIFRTRIPVLK